MKCEIIKLSDVCDLIAGFAFKSKDFGDFEDKIIKIADIVPPRVMMDDLVGVNLSNYKKDKLEKFIAKSGDYVLAMTGATIGKIGRIHEKTAYINQRVLLFRPKQNIDKDFLYYAICGKSFYNYIISFVDSETAQPNISATTIGKYELYLPTLNMQRKIAAFLKSLDDKIELNNKINANLQQQAQAIFKSWFLDFEPFQDGEFVESELGPIPKEWKVGTISDLGTVVGGATPSKSKPEYYTSNGIGWITPKDLAVNKNLFVSHGAIDITQEGLKNSSARIMPKGTVLFSSRAPIGYMAIANDEVTTNQGFKSVVPHENVGTAYVYYFLKYNLPMIDSLGSGSTFKEVSGAIMKSVLALVPDDNTLRKFTNVCDSMFEKQECLERENSALINMRDALLPKLMNGEIEVNGI